MTPGSVGVDLLGLALARLDDSMLRAAADLHDLDLPTPCSDWDLGDLLGHLEAMAGAYVLWVSACIGGRRQSLRAGDDLAAWNATMIQRVPRRDLAMARPRWHELAQDHLALVRAFPDGGGLVLANGRSLTAAEHAGIAAVEWYVHEWDLTLSLGRPAAPDDDLASGLVDVWNDVLADLTGEEATGEDPNDALLRASGRAPT